MEVVETTMNGQQFFHGVAFPLVLTPSEASKQTATLETTLQYIREHQEELLAKLLKHGAIFFRGFPTKTAEAFNDVVAAFPFENFPGMIGSAAPRRHIVGTVHTSNESPPERQIPWHHEMAQVPVYPTKLFFYCDLPAASGGATPILPSHEVYQRVLAKHPQFVKDLQEKGVKYVRILPEENDNESAIGRGWKSTFNATTREEAEEACRKLGNTWEWTPEGYMKTITKVLPAMKTYPEKGNIFVWFNSIVAAYLGWQDSRNEASKAVVYGDDTPLPKEAVLDTAAIMEEVCVDLDWQQGDIILIDNNQVMHARRSFVPPRRVYASLAK